MNAKVKAVHKPAMMTAVRKSKRGAPAKSTTTEEQQASALFEKLWARETPEFKKVVLEGAAADMKQPMRPLTKQQLKAVERHTKEFIKSFSGRRA